MKETTLFEFEDSAAACSISIEDNIVILDFHDWKRIELTTMEARRFSEALANFAYIINENTRNNTPLIWNREEQLVQELK